MSYYGTGIHEEPTPTFQVYGITFWNGLQPPAEAEIMCHFHATNWWDAGRVFAQITDNAQPPVPGFIAGEIVHLRKASEFKDAVNDPKRDVRHYRTPLVEFVRGMKKAQAEP